MGTLKTMRESPCSYLKKWQNQSSTKITQKMVKSSWCFPHVFQGTVRRIFFGVALHIIIFIIFIVVIIYTLWLFNIAMENGPFIDDFPIKTSIYNGFSIAMLNNQRVIEKTRPNTCTLRQWTVACWKSHSSTIFPRTKAPWLVRGFPSQPHLIPEGISISIYISYVYIYICIYDDYR